MRHATVVSMVRASEGWSLLLALGLCLVALGCGGHYRVEGPPTYSEKGVVVNPQQLKVTGQKLQLRFLFVNRGDQTITVDRNQLVLRVAGGRTLARFKGTWGGMTSGVHRIPPGLSHEVFADFLFEGAPPGRATLDLSGVTAGGKSMGLPEYPVSIARE